jgi:hypothetical protein
MKSRDDLNEQEIKTYLEEVVEELKKNEEQEQR